MKRPIAVALLVALAAAALHWLWTSNEDRFEQYVSDWFANHELPSPRFECNMNRPGGFFSRSRAGYCLFSWPAANFSRLSSALTLKPIPYERHVEGCSRLPSFSKENDALRSISHRPDSHPEIAAFLSENSPGPIFSGNTSSSFSQLYYNTKEGLGCIDLHYPFG